MIFVLVVIKTLEKEQNFVLVVEQKYRKKHSHKIQIVSKMHFRIKIQQMNKDLFI